MNESTYRKTVIQDLGTQTRQEPDSAAGDPRAESPHGRNAQGHPCRNRARPLLDGQRRMSTRNWSLWLRV